MIPIRPQRITDHSQRFMRVLLLRRKNTAQHGTNSKRWKNSGGQTRAVNLLGSRIPGKFVVGASVASHRREGPGRLRINPNLPCGDRCVRPTSNVVSDQNQPLRILKRQRPQKNALHQREHSSRSANSKSQRKDNSQADARRLRQLTKCQPHFPPKCKHASS